MSLRFRVRVMGIIFGISKGHINCEEQLTTREYEASMEGLAASI